MSNLPDGCTQEALDRPYETPSQERARELIEEIETDWSELLHEVKAATQSYCVNNGADLPTELGRVLKEVRERYT